MSEPKMIEPNWENDPVVVHGLSCRVGKVPDGWIISHHKSPRFCFGAETREAVLAKAERGIAFWEKTEKVALPSPPHSEQGKER